MADQQGPNVPSTGDPVRDYVRANLKTMTGEGIRDWLVAAVAYVVLGLAIAFAVRWAAGAWRISGGWALLIGIVLVPVYGGLMLGTCLAAASLTSA